MRLALALLFGLLASLTATGSARADYEQSQTWFMALPVEQREAAQADLSLLGTYRFLVDGQFGTGTYNALVAFQRELGAVKTGALSAAQLAELDSRAAAVRNELGFEVVRDTSGRVELALPMALLTQTRETDEGTLWASPDGGITVETLVRPAGVQSFQDIFDELSRPGKGRIVTTKSFGEKRFLITGHQDGRDFYTMFRNLGGTSVGYRLTWSLANAPTGNVLSIYIASNFAPVDTLTPDVTTRKSVSPTASVRRFGAFSLPEGMPDVIALDGEVSEGFYRDFERALSARPGARIMLLNSPGGYVDSALAVARIVHERAMSTVVAKNMGCYSACAYIFFAGQPRAADGELGVHQISADVADLVLAQTTLGDVIDTLNGFGVSQTVIVQMLRTPPEDMYVFSRTELVDWDVNRGGPVDVAEVDGLVGLPEVTPPPAGLDALVAYVNLALQNNEEQARRALKYASDHWAGVLGDASPEIERAQTQQGIVYRVRVAARSVESANTMCAAIKSAGGGCYVTRLGE